MPQRGWAISTLPTNHLVFVNDLKIEVFEKLSQNILDNCPTTKTFNNRTDTSIKVCNIMLRFHIYFFGNSRDNSSVASIFLHLIYILAIFYNVLNANTI